MRSQGGQRTRLMQYRRPPQPPPFQGGENGRSRTGRITVESERIHTPFHQSRNIASPKSPLLEKGGQGGSTRRQARPQNPAQKNPAGAKRSQGDSAYSAPAISPTPQPPLFKGGERRVADKKCRRGQPMVSGFCRFPFGIHYAQYLNRRSTARR